MKVIFLDKDGVLNSDEYFDKIEGLDIEGIEIKQWLSEHPDTEDFVILDDEIFDSYDEELMKKLIKISNGNGMSFGEGLQRKDINQIIQRLGRKRQRDEKDLEI